MEQFEIKEIAELLGMKDLTIFSISKEIDRLKAENEKLKKQLGANPKSAKEYKDERRS